jgi:hypothetical protein
MKKEDSKRSWREMGSGKEIVVHPVWKIKGTPLEKHLIVDTNT